MQPEQTTVSQPQQQQPSGQLQPLAQFECWYIPEGKYTIFNYRKSIVVLYPGWMVVYQKSDHAELARIPLGADLKMKYFVGFARFAQLNGRKYSFFTFSNLFMTTPMWAYGIFGLSVVINLIISLRLTEDTNLGLRGMSLFVQLAGLAILFVGFPKAKALVQAAHRAAGVAS